jgi:hypothetical protein
MEVQKPWYFGVDVWGNYLWLQICCQRSLSLGWVDLCDNESMYAWGQVGLGLMVSQGWVDESLYACRQVGLGSMLSY